MRKTLFVLLLFGLVLFISDIIVPDVAFAKSDCKDTEQYKCLDDGSKIYYYLDIVPDRYAEEDGDIIDEIPILSSFYNVAEDVNPLTQVVNVLNSIANIAFQLNMLATDMILSMMDFVFKEDFINGAVNEIAKNVQSISGISSSMTIGKTGLFGSLIKIIVLTSAVYTLFLLFFKKSIIGSFESIAKTIIVITLAMLLFSNYSNFLTIANTTTTQLSALVLGSKGSDLDSKSVKNNMKANIWDTFVNRPYAYMMFNLRIHDDGFKKRFSNVVKHSPIKNKGKDRLEAVKKEAKEKNTGVLHSNIENRLAFTPMYLMINGILSIPILIFLLSLIMFQFWFLIMALFAPFALIVAAIPGQFNVLKRYLLELFFPLFAKIGVSFGLLILIYLSDIISNIDKKWANPIMGYQVVAMINIALFVLAFSLRKRIMNILRSGSEALQQIREQGNPITQPLKKGVQVTSTTGGAVVGGVVGGAMGATIGANIGKQVGNVATGEGNMESALRTGISSYNAYSMAKLNQSRLEALSENGGKSPASLFNKPKSYNEPMLVEGLSTLDDNQPPIETIRNLDELENLPISELSNAEYSHMLNETDFKTGNDIEPPSPELNLKSQDMAMKVIRETPVTDFNKLDLQAIIRRLDEDEQKQFVDNLKTYPSKELLVGKTVQDIITNPFEEEKIEVPRAIEEIKGLNISEVSDEEYKNLLENTTFTIGNNSQTFSGNLKSNNMGIGKILNTSAAEFSMEDLQNITSKLYPSQQGRFIHNVQSLSKQELEGLTIKEVINFGMPKPPNSEENK